MGHKDAEEEYFVTPWRDMADKPLSGKVLRKHHRTAMYANGGLIQRKDRDGNEYSEKTEKYQSLRAWLRDGANKRLQSEAEGWLQRKREQKPAGRIKGPNDPHRPSLQRRWRMELNEKLRNLEETDRASRGSGNRTKKAS